MAENQKPRRWTPIVSLVLLGIVPVTVLGLCAYWMSAAWLEKSNRSNNLAAATITRQLLEVEFTHRVQTLQGFSENPDFIAHVNAHDEDEVRKRLAVLVDAHPRVVRAFVTDPDGRLWSDFPKAEESLGEPFDHRDWYRGLAIGWQPYVSKVYRRHAEPQPLLVAVAVPVREPGTRNVIAALVYQIRLEGITQLLREVEIGVNGHAFLLDHAGVVAAHPHVNLQEREVADYADLPIIREARASKPFHQVYLDPVSGVEMVATSLPCRIQGNRWVVVAQQPSSDAYRPLRILALQFAGAGLLVIAVLVICAMRLGRYHNQIAQLNRRLGAFNEQLSAENQEGQRKFETLLANLPGMAYRCQNNEQWTMEFVSAGVRELTGFEPEALIGNREKAYGDLIHAEDRTRVWNETQDALAQRQPFTITYRIQTADGQEKWVWEQSRGVFNEIGELEAIEGFITDISEEKDLEDQLRQAQKMESIGRLAGGIAHDFNNMLTVINGYSKMILGAEPADETIRHRLEQISQAGDRAAALTRQLLAFSRKQVLQPEVLDLNKVTAEMDKMLHRLIGEDVELITNLRENLAPVEFDPAQIEQILMNLVINARDAMPEGGKLTIETANVELDADYARTHVDAQPGPHVMLAISDNGHGMDSETQARIFDPFFTTKEQGKGTGLGLSTVHGIVKQSGGNIWVYSELNVGTTFKVYLPKAQNGAQPVDRQEAVVAIAQGTETILVVEDEEAVRELVRDILTDGGYVVLDASDVDGALRLCKEHEGDIHMLLTDVVLPKMGGRQLAEEVVKVRPDVRVVYMSGYTDNAIVHHGVLDPGTAFIEKPISPDVLLRKVREFFS